MEYKPQHAETDELIKSIKTNLMLNPGIVIGPSYHVMNKLLADLYMDQCEELKGIYHLTEAHACSLRQHTMLNYDEKDDLIKSKKELEVTHGIQKMFVEFDSEIALQEENGLLRRLRDMPSEWTVVQLTTKFESQESLTASTRNKDFVQKPRCLHITLLPCGNLLNKRAPVSVKVAPPNGTEGMPTLFDLMDQAINNLKFKRGRSRQILAARNKGSENIKEVVSELSSRYLREWKCLLLGRLYSKTKEDNIVAFVNKAIGTHQLDSRTRQLLYCVASGAAYLTSAEIESAVASLKDNFNLALGLIKAIQDFKKNSPDLKMTRRHPVILILDEELDRLPWEMMEVLRYHPVSRIPSIHFLHGLYHLHKEHIVNGCRLVKHHEMGFYIINPDKDLNESESKLINFLKLRIPSWKGVQGEVPNEGEFRTALTDNSIFLYCGHFNGTHLYKQDDISKMRVVALPLLFGCSSVALYNKGGRAQLSGVSDKYFIAGCACVIGMLWTVTSEDTDCMTVTLLNSWLPGKPVEISNFNSSLEFSNKELELLRLLGHVRECAKVYSNSAALVARGIPVTMVEDSDL